ncbi:MAG: hypothetical protein LBL77_01555 [Endomicrobium sp.]|jgi:hypothetical protein|nr:hypothetical protein [Endomicrobium sp.]
MKNSKTKSEKELGEEYEGKNCKHDNILNIELSGCMERKRVLEIMDYVKGNRNII